jgi:predicted secreted protein
LEFLKQEKGISVQTGSFNTQPVYNKQQIVGWRSRQSITVKSTDATRLSDLLGKLQEHVQIEHIGYGVSDEGRAKAEDQLIRLAIGNFNARARLVSGEMGSRDYRLVNMNVSTSQQGPIIHRTMAMMERADANVAPPIKAGTQNIQVTIQGSIELQLK